MQDIRPMTPEEFLAGIQPKGECNCGSCRRDMRDALRALLLHVGEDIKNIKTPDGWVGDYLDGRSDAIDDCKRVIDKMISEI